MPKQQVSFQKIVITFVQFVERVLFQVWLKLFRDLQSNADVPGSFTKAGGVVVISNHQKYLDPFVLSTVLPVNTLPIKFMTWHKYYNSFLRPFMYLTGCFPTHNNKHAGVDGAVYYLQNGYNSFIFPEGKRVLPGTTPKVYPGVSNIIEKFPEARVVLMSIDWQERSSLFSRPFVSITATIAPDSLNVQSPEAIMKEIYSNKDATLKA